jgi:hypothetical protein
MSPALASFSRNSQTVVASGMLSSMPSCRNRVHDSRSRTCYSTCSSERLLSACKISIRIITIAITHQIRTARQKRLFFDVPLSLAEFQGIKIASASFPRGRADLPALFFLVSSGVSTTASMSARKLSEGTSRSIASSGSLLADSAVPPTACPHRRTRTAPSSPPRIMLKYAPTLCQSTTLRLKDFQI